jgi:hypothetical protein
VYTIPEQPEIVGTENQVAYAGDIRERHIKAVQRDSFRDAVYRALARSSGFGKEALLENPQVDVEIQNAINAILIQKQAKNIIENCKKGELFERVAWSAQRRLGWSGDDA